MAEDAGKADKAVDTGFTAGESTLLVTIMQNLTNDIQFDADAVATKLGYKDGSVVKARWNQIKRKKITAASPSSAGVKKRTTKKSAKAAATSSAAEGEGEEDEEVPDTPVKAPAKRGRKPKANKAEDEGDDEGAAKEKIKAEDEE